MNECWKDAVVSKIAVAMYVPKDNGKRYHSNRPFHGFVINDEDTEKDYIFSDGTVLHTDGGALFYLPKGSTYTIKDITPGGCYAINFVADISDTPFLISFRNKESVFKLFKNAAKEWRMQTELCELIVKRSVYDIIIFALDEQNCRYQPGSRSRLILPAIEKISSEFTSADMNVSSLAGLCGISDVYFRRIFLDELGVSPKEYIISMRIRYAKQLLESGQFLVSDVATLCGFSEPCHFSREFTKRVGVSPNEYKINRKQFME